MRHLLACTAIAPVLVAMTATNAAAETTIGSSTTTAVKTSTVASGAADAITVSSAGSITLTSGTAITMDSNNNVSNAGSLTINDADNATGILVKAGTTGNITNSGTITLTEDYTATDTDSDGDIDGTFAKGTNRNGILVESGAAHTGNIDTTGTITIEGNNSAGIRVNSTLIGNLSTYGTISVVGDNSYGVVANDIDGNATIRGSISTKGANSTAVALLGDVDGAVKIQGTIVSTGYRSTTRPSDVTKLDADDLLQGGPALVIAGNVSGGIVFDVAPTASDDDDEDDTDIDDDGLLDSTETTATVINYGSAAAVQIGSATADTSIGVVQGDSSGYGVVVRGAIAGYGIYDGVDANAMVIGGLGGDVDIAKGVLVAGSITAISYDSNATALRLGSGATSDAIEISGTVAASGAALANTSARGLVIDAGAQVNSVKVSGTVAAVAADDEKGRAIAILNSSGTVASLSNTGTISATGGLTNTAIDLSANSSGVTLTQALASSTATAPSIIGDVKLGSGDDVMTVSAGRIVGDVSLGAGNNSLSLSGSSTLTGDLSYAGTGATLTLADTASVTGALDFGGASGTMTLNGTSSYSGAISNSGNMALVLNGGTLAVSNTGSVALASLSASSGSALGVTINGADGTNTVYDVAGAASFASGSKVKVALTQVGGSEGDYVIVRAASLSGTPALDSATLLPYMFKGSVSSDTTTGDVTLSIAAKTTSELGLTGSLSRAYSAIFNALDNDSSMASAYLDVTDGQTLNGALRQMLPEHSGSTFEAVTAGSRATARILSDPNGIYRTKDGKLGFWLQQVAFGSSKSIGDTASYDINGWGAGGGVEYLTDLGAFGGSFAYIHGRDTSDSSNSSADSDQFELAAHWRGSWGPLQAFARVSAAHIDFDGTRNFTLDDVVRKATGDWSGKLYSATAGASYQLQFNRFSLRPGVGIDYYRLKEGGYSESGGGDAFNLTVDGRTSDEMTANGTIAAGYDFGSLNREDGWARFELEGGRRQLIGGSLGDTVAHFKDGDDFILVADKRTSGWTGRARLYGGTDTFRVGGEFGAEEQQNHVAISFRATVNFVL